jgi:hypothetical protein
MPKAFKSGDHVRWQTSQGETSGVVERKITSTTRIKGYRAKANPTHPEYLVRSDKTDAKAAHKPEALKKR